MKYIAWFMVVLVVLAIAGVGYIYFTAQVTIGESAVQTLPATQQEELFNQIKHEVELQSFQGTMLSKEAIEEDISSYGFNTYAIEIKNQTFLPADTIEIQTVPSEFDVLQLKQENPLRIEKRSDGRIQATILTKQGTYATREFVITYYLWGLPFTLRAVVEG